MRALFSGLVLLMALLVAGCSGVDPSTPEQPASPAASDTSSGEGADEIPRDPDAGSAPQEEGATEAPQGRSDSGPALRIAGLPAGNPEAASVVGQTWCGAVRTDPTPAVGVRLVVERVRTDPAGLAAAGVACQGAPVCLGATLDADHAACAVAVVPPVPPTPVRAALDVRLECDTAQLCRDYLARLTPNFWWTITPPPEAFGTGTGEGTSSLEPGTGTQPSDGGEPSQSPTTGEGGP